MKAYFLRVIWFYFYMNECFEHYHKGVPMNTKGDWWIIKKKKTIDKKEKICKKKIEKAKVKN
jgi:hypothetical protein